MALIDDYIAAVLADSPVAFWKLDEPSGLPQDSSGAARHFTAQAGSPTYGVAGPFAGASAIRLPSGALFSRGGVSTQNDNFSLELWLNIETTPTSANGAVFDNVITSPLGGWGLLLQTSRALQAIAQNVGFLTASAALAASTWHHVVIVRRAGTWRYYVNGTESASMGTTTPVQTPNLVRISAAGGAQLLQSLVSYYDTPLSWERITAHYAAAGFTPPSGGSGRASQLPAETVVLPDTAKARVSQAPVETIVRPDSAQARISQAPVEAVVATSSDLRASQVPTEVVTAPVWDERQRYYDIVRLDYPDGLWRLDEASGNFIDSTGTHPFIPYGDVSYQQPGPAPGWPAISVGPGGGGASQPSYSTAVDNFSFEAWFMPTSVGAADQVIFSNVNGAAGWALVIQPSGKLQVIVNGTTYLAESVATLANGTWYHIVVERRAGQWRYYVNGEIDTPNAGTAAPNAGATTMNLFGSGDLEASMATAAYYERALTGAEIKSHYGAVFEIVLPFPLYQSHFVARVIDPEDSSTWTVDDIGKRPQAVIFMGTNWSELDTIVTTTGRGIFRGMIGRDPDTGSVIQTATSPVFPGDGQRVSETQAICMGNAAGGVHYSATVTLTDDGFVCAFDTTGPGTIVALVLKDSNHACMIHGNNGTYDIGFRGRSHIATGWWGTVGNRDNMHGSWFGGGQWQGGDLSWEGVGMTCHSYPTSQGAQYSNELTHIGLSNGIFAATYAFIGPFMRGAWCSAAPPEDSDATTLSIGVDEGPGSFVVWDGMSNCGFLAKPAAAADAPIETVLSQPEFEPAAIISYCTDGGPSMEQGGRGNGGFGVALEDGFRWACLVDGGAFDDAHRAAYQSFDLGWISGLEPGGVHAGEIEFTETGFITETTLDSTTEKSIVFHAMGIPERMAWIPQSYRIRD